MYLLLHLCCLLVLCLQLCQSDLTNGAEVANATFRSNSGEINEVFRRNVGEPVKFFKPHTANHLMEAERNAMYVGSNVFLGKRYWFTRFGVRPYFNIDYASRHCKQIGGYLHVPETIEEFEFVRNFLKKHNYHPYVYFGGREFGGTNGHKYLALDGKTRMSFTWAPNEPSYASQDCVSYWKLYDHYVDNNFCDFPSGWQTAHICETSELI